MREPNPPYQRYFFRFEYEDWQNPNFHEFNKAFSEWIKSEGIFFEPELLESTKEFMATAPFSPKNYVALKFIARPRTADDDLREQIEFMIDNING